MKKKRVLVLMHHDLVPPDNIKSEKDIRFEPWITEFDVISALKKLKHEVELLGVISDLKKIREKIEEFKPHIVFNLLEEFDGEALFDQNVVSYLELLKVSYTGCNPRGLILARDKALAKKILSYHRIKSPRFFVALKKKRPKVPKGIRYPLIVKCLYEEASFGLAKASVVNNEEKLLERLEYIHKKLDSDAIVEEFIEGSEYYVGIFGQNRLTPLPPVELNFKNSESPEKEFYSEKAKWNEKYRKRKGIETKIANLPPEILKRLFTITKKVYKVLNISGYARIDFRINEAGEIFVIEANPNPNIASDDEFAKSAAKAGLNYPKLIEKILSLAV